MLGLLRHHRTYYYLDGAEPDVTAPVLSSPSGVAAGATTAVGSVVTDEGNGTLYWVVTQSATPPSVAQVQAGQNHLGAAADDAGTQAVSSAGGLGAFAADLVPETTYYFHFQQQDAATNDSTVVSSTSFTTPPAAEGQYGRMGYKMGIGL